MAEMYMAVFDATLRVAVPNLPRPAYMPPQAPPSHASGRAQMLRLSALVPGSVKGYEQ